MLIVREYSFSLYIRSNQTIIILEVALDVLLIYGKLVLHVPLHWTQMQISNGTRMAPETSGDIITNFEIYHFFKSEGPCRIPWSTMPVQYVMNVRT